MSAPSPSVSPPAALAAWPTYLRLGAVSLLWGGTFIAGQQVAAVLPPLTAAAGRFAIAAVLLLMLTWRQNGGLPRLDRTQLLQTFGLGLTGVFLYNLCFFGALAQMPAGRTALFIALNPSVTALIMALFLREQLSWRKWLGIVLAFLGAATIISRGDLLGAARDIGSAIGPGEALMLTAVTVWALYTLIGRKALARLTPLVATTYAACWGLLLLSIGALFEMPRWPAPAFNGVVTLGLVYLGAFGTVIGFVWYYQGVKVIGPARTAVFNNLVPVFGVLLANLLLGEALTPDMVVGAALAFTGVTLTNRG